MIAAILEHRKQYKNIRHSVKFSIIWTPKLCVVVSSILEDFNARNKCLTAKLLEQGYWYHKLRKAFSKFYLRHQELVSKFNVGLKSLLHQGLSEPEFYGDLVYKFKNG